MNIYVSVSGIHEYMSAVREEVCSQVRSVRPNPIYAIEGSRMLTIR